MKSVVKVHSTNPATSKLSLCVPDVYIFNSCTRGHSVLQHIPSIGSNLR